MGFCTINESQSAHAGHFVCRTKRVSNGRAQKVKRTHLNIPVHWPLICLSFNLHILSNLHNPSRDTFPATPAALSNRRRRRTESDYAVKERSSVLLLLLGGLWNLCGSLAVTIIRMKAKSRDHRAIRPREQTSRSSPTRRDQNRWICFLSKAISKSKPQR